MSDLLSLTLHTIGSNIKKRALRLRLFSKVLEYDIKIVSGKKHSQLYSYLIIYNQYLPIGVGENNIGAPKMRKYDDAIKLMILSIL
jgi:hypothetical protein